MKRCARTAIGDGREGLATGAGAGVTRIGGTTTGAGVTAGLVQAIMIKPSELSTTSGVLLWDRTLPPVAVAVVQPIVIVPPLFEITSGHLLLDMTLPGGALGVSVEGTVELTLVVLGRTGAMEGTICLGP